MKQIVLFKGNKSLLTRLALLVMMIVVGGGNVWGNTTFFSGSVASGWVYKNASNGSGTNMTVTTGGELSNYNTTSGARYYTSTSSLTITSGQTILITARKYGASSAGDIKVKYSSDDGETWTTAKEFTYSSDLTTTDQVLTVDNITGTYKIEFEFLYVYISSIILKDPDNVPTLSITHPLGGDAFGYVTTNTTKTYTVKNTGSGSMNVDITSSDAAFTLSASSLAGITNDGSGKTFDVTFNYNALQPQPHSATITITPTFDGAVAQSFVVSAGPEVELNEDKATTWATGSGKNVYVKYTAKNGWNTICLPISVSTYKTQLFGSGATVKCYELNSYNEETGTLTFTTASYPGSQTPYLVYIENAASNSFLINNIYVGYAPNSPGTKTKSSAKFKGTFAPIEAGDFSSDMYGVTSSGQIRPGDGEYASLKGYRAYFTGVSAPSSGSVKMFIIDGDDATDVGFVKMVDENAKEVYNLAGQKVQKARKGIYIVNGKKVVIK